LRFLLRKVEALLKSERNSDTDSRSKAYNYECHPLRQFDLWVILGHPVLFWVNGT